MAELERVDRYKAPVVMEGGSFHVDGQGTLLTTEECLLSPGRNPGLGREEIEGNLREYLGVDKIIWLARGIDPDETNGHVDDVACFVKPGVVLAAVTDDKSRLALRAPARQPASPARRERRQRPPARVHTLPMPAIMEITAEEAWGVDTAEGTIPRKPGDKTAASYLNFLIVNGGLIMPLFDDPNDAVALRRA